MFAELTKNIYVKQQQHLKKEPSKKKPCQNISRRCRSCSLF